MAANLPQLTPDERTAVGLLLVSRRPLAQIAADCGMSVLEFVELCADPRVQAHIDAARALARKRANLIAQDARAAAIHTLQDIAEQTEPPKAAQPDADRLALIHAIERRRAATTILRAANPTRRAHRTTHRPRVDAPHVDTPHVDTPRAEHTPAADTTKHTPAVLHQPPPDDRPDAQVPDLASTIGLASRPPNSWP